MCKFKKFLRRDPGSPLQGAVHATRRGDGKAAWEEEIRICPLPNVENRFTSMHVHLVNMCYYCILSFVAGMLIIHFMLPFYALPISIMVGLYAHI
jgi:hypothetical protein